MTEVNELLTKANKIFEEAKVILANSEASAEEQAKVPKMIEDAKAIKSRAEQLMELDKVIQSTGVAARQTKSDVPETQPMQFKTMGEFWTACAQAGNIKYRGPLDPRLKSWADPDEPKHTQQFNMQSGFQEKATMIEGIGARGGFLVPTEYLPQLQALDPMINIVRTRATVIPMRRRTIQIPVLDQTSTTAGDGHWFGGVHAYWTEEQGTKTQSDPTFRQAQLTAHKLICYTRSSDELLDDSAIGLDAFLRGPLGLTGAISWWEEYAFLQGTGAGQPLGVINAGATINVAASANPPAPATLFIDLVNMLEHFLPGARGVWVINQSHMSDLLTMNGPAGNASYLWGNASAGQPNTLLGWPVIWSEKLPAPGTAGSILLADFRYYLIGDRQATTVESTNIERFQYDETSWRAVHRVDGQPWLSTWFTLQDGTATVSPFVILGAKTT